MQVRHAVPPPAQVKPAEQSALAVQGVPATPTPTRSGSHATGPLPMSKLSAPPVKPRPMTQS